MATHLNETITFDAGADIRITRDGYLTASPRIARTGIQEYRAGEIGLSDRDPSAVLNIWRPEAEVFAADALASMAHRPITDGHPSVPVTADNWREYARGDTGDEVIRDGEFVRVPIKLMDAALIDQVHKGKRQLSVGYTCDLEIIDGTTPDGHKYDAIQRNIRANHLAVCQVARGGPKLAIVDERRETPETQDGDGRMPHTMIIDGLQVPDVSDAAKAAIEKLQGQVKDATALVQARDATVAELTTARDTLTGEKVALEAKLKDAEVTPAKLQELADARAKVIADAKRIAPEIVTDGKTDAEIRKLAVAAKIGDAALTMNDDAVAGAFTALVPAAASDDVRDVFSGGLKNLNATDAAALAQKAWVDADPNAWRNAQ